MCGIAGIINNGYLEFDQKSFNILGCLNDQRGGDSCGIFIDGLVKKGIDNNKLFTNLTKSILYPLNSQINLIHDRKTSTGLSTNLVQCQPVIISEDGIIKYVLLHNGFIENSKELAKKYIPDLNIEGFSDSMIMAHIFYQNGYDCLGEYEGAASFCIIDYREEKLKILFWTGKSKWNSYKEDYSVERQLYYIKQENRFIFSSLSLPLFLIDNSANINKFPTNVLLSLIDNDLIEVKKYNRESLKSKTKIINLHSYSCPYDYDYDEDDVCYVNSNSYNNCIRFNINENKYYHYNTKVHGVYELYESGYVGNKSIYTNTFGFWEGRLLVDPAYFDFLDAWMNLVNSSNLDETLLEDIIDYCCYGLVDPDMPLVINNNLEYIEVKNYTYYSFFPTNKMSNNSNIYTTCSFKEALKNLNKIKLRKTLNVDTLNEIIEKRLSNYDI